MLVFWLIEQYGLHFLWLFIICLIVYHGVRIVSEFFHDGY